MDTVQLMDLMCVGLGLCVPNGPQVRHVLTRQTMKLMLTVAMMMMMTMTNDVTLNAVGNSHGISWFHFHCAV